MGAILILLKDDNIENFPSFMVVFNFWWSLQSTVAKKMRAIFERIIEMNTRFFFRLIGFASSMTWPKSHQLVGTSLHAFFEP